MTVRSQRDLGSGVEDLVLVMNSTLKNAERRALPSLSLLPSLLRLRSLLPLQLLHNLQPLQSLQLLRLRLFPRLLVLVSHLNLPLYLHPLEAR